MKVPFKSNTDNTSHLELPYTENISLSRDMLGYFSYSNVYVFEICYYSFVMCCLPTD